MMPECTIQLGGVGDDNLVLDLMCIKCEAFNFKVNVHCLITDLLVIKNETASGVNIQE